MKKLIAIIATGCLSLTVNAQASGDKSWSPINESTIEVKGKRQIIPQKYLTFHLNGSELKDKLFSAPNERAVAIEKSSCIVSLPLPDGSIQKFWVVESPIMEQGLAAQFPNMRTFSVKGIDDVYANGKLDWNEFGFHGMVRTPNGDYFIDPYSSATITEYISYYTADFIKDPSQQIPEAGVIKGTDANKNNSTAPTPQKKSTGAGINNRTETPAICVGAQLRTYRLAVACTGEYAAAATGQSNPTVAQTLAKIQTSVNRVDGVYETEVAVRMVLVATETLVVFTSPSTDPFTGNNNANTLINESHTVIANAIGLNNFDIGHTFSTGGGGLAFQGCVCSTSNKGRGITGSGSPVGDPYDIDYVAHEMGHQFGGSHTFNATSGSCGSGNRNASTSVEPGSGVTIMAYAGICGNTDNLANHSIPYFHAISYDEIVNYTNSGGGNNCAVTAASPSTAANANNLPPVVSAPGSITIPILTPFSLTGSATDPDGDPVTFSWEETDPGVNGGGAWNSVNPPFFRSYTPTTTPTRYFPALPQLANNSYTTTRGEVLPTVAQTLNFRLTARDNRMGGGGVCYTSTEVNVDAAGPFTVTYPSATGIIWGVGTQQTITWDVNGTDQGAISCDSVKIWISYNGNQTYSVFVAATPNDGSELITVPTLTATNITCRIKITAIGNVFYDIGNSNFTISTSVATGISSLSKNNPVGLSVWPNPFNEQFNFAAGNLNSASVTQLRVMDVLGKTVLQTDYSSRSELKETVDLSGISPGVYFIKVSNDHNQAVYRIVKN